MDVTSISAVSATAALGASGAPPALPPSSSDVSSASDAQLIILAGEGNSQAILELEKRDAARAAAAGGDKTPPSAPADTLVPGSDDRGALPAGVAASENPAVPGASVDAQTPRESDRRDAVQAARLLAREDETAATIRLDAHTASELARQDAVHAAKTLADAGQTAAAPEQDAIGNIVDKFV